jgi:2'-5' RNA ligase
MVRLFAALPVPDDLRDRLKVLQGGLDGRLVEPASFHVTLAFFGELAAPVAEDLHAALGQVAAPGFSLWLDGAGAFGNAKPHALYAAVRREPALDHLRAKVLRAGREAGLTLPAEKYVPHVTLARFGKGTVPAPTAAAMVAARAAFLAGPWAVDAFVLYRSDLGRAGPIYTELARYPLRPA